MSVSPFPPGEGLPLVQDATTAQRQASYPVRYQMQDRGGDEPFSSAAAYRSPVASPPPRAPSSISHGAPPIPSTYERASALKSPPPPATSLVIQERGMPSNSPSPAPPNGETPILSSPTQRGTGARTTTTAADSRSACTASKRDATASISKSARSSTTSWFYGGPNSFIRVPSKMAALYILVTFIEAAIVIALVGYTFGRIVAEVENFTQNLKTVSIYLAVFVFGCVFQVLVAWDAVRLKNTMQLIGVLIFNIALTITAAIEIGQVRDALNVQDSIAGGITCPDDPSRLCRARSLFPDIERYLIVVTATCGVAEFFMLYLSFKLWKEFGWIIYQKIGADLKVRNMFFWYQLFIVFLKFSFFFGVGFTVIYLILVADTTDWEYGVTIAAVPIAIVSLFAAGFAVRREWSSLMVLSLFLMIAGLTYFVYKLTQVWVPATADQYMYVHTTITFISGFAILSLGLTWLNGIICLLNFHKGLKPAHDAIGTFGGVRRTRARGERNGESEGAALDLERDVEPKEHSETSTPYIPPHRGSLFGHGGGGGTPVGGIDPRRGSNMIASPVYSYSSHGGHGAASPPPSAMMVDRRTSGAGPHAYNPPPMAATLGNAPVLAPQPILAAAPLSPHASMGSPPPTQMQAAPPPQQSIYHQLPTQVPSQAFVDAHQPRPSTTRISLD
ncbi:hypothetical protein NDA11_006952 [Ustilago hordei]|uniref:Uncharacterized protein n=1 Tax=Ustilago hordei TaxID=120017 RepID=I2G3I3_USTHO|nr:uncharacterized protein UHO2_00783 [Ustilago hordei]KAJ1037680.1 hypothetical protein NDA10_007012 [Ustilago hordei]KAJ1583596.1 hypothetical protein NDA15_005086 [Ustilago hordei]KAJ1584783.1 hypothetical protein NDA11_006952 [Ustilago hordei]KAJ1591533.1 hypothetical protein NDA12_000605 [Ustilago hordei]KAJ1603292.1 hypothetical protein NDA14_005400 [Ustilago hordei]